MTANINYFLVCRLIKNENSDKKVAFYQNFFNTTKTVIFIQYDFYLFIQLKI